MMAFDMVHDAQAVHRALVLAFSFPGRPTALGVEQRAQVFGLPQTLAAVALTLIDGESTFSCSVSTDLTVRTGASQRTSNEADFLVLSDVESWTAAFESARRGTLADPHLGATILAHASIGTTRRFVAQGPGIEESLVLELPDTGWVEARNQACREFPLGVDLLWTRPDGTVIAIPRTTRLEEER